MASNIYAPVGFCKTLGGSGKATTIMGIIGGVIGGAGGYIMAKDSPDQQVTATAVGIALGALPLALGTYFQCKGVELGVPVKK